MTWHYSDSERESDPHALPDVEVFWYDPSHDTFNGCVALFEEQPEKGWYWWRCFPGCIPDGGPHGPFESEEEALEDSRAEGGNG